MFLHALIIVCITGWLLSMRPMKNKISKFRWTVNQDKATTSPASACIEVRTLAADSIEVSLHLTYKYRW